MLAMEKETFFDEICSKLNIDTQVKKNANKQLAEINRNTILDGDPKHWICCAIFTVCCEIKIPTVSMTNTFVQGNGVSLVKLINECNLDIFSFFEKIEIWFKVASVPNSVQEKVENLKRNFRLSMLSYEEYSKLFRKLFSCKDTADDVPTKTPSKGSRKKQTITPYTCQKLFEMCWTLFVAVKGDNPEVSGDFVNSINGLICCMDCTFQNVIHDNRRDLINSSFPGLPRTFFSPSYDSSKAPVINVIEKLCIEDSAMRAEASRYVTKIRRYITEKGLVGDFNTILSINNYDANLKKLNDYYETFILSGGQFDERIYLSHPEFGSKFYGKSYVQSNSQGEFIPQTPLSGPELSHHSASKLSPVSSCRQNVQKLQALYSGVPAQPQNSLKELLICHSDTILDDLKARLNRMKEIFCTKMMPNGQDRFQIAEALYYRLLENIINSERKTHGRFDLFINDDLFNETLIILCLEIVLFAYSLHKKLPTLLECFNLEAFHFYKLIEVAIRNNKDYFTNDIIKHLKAIEEQCIDSLVWISGSTLWKMVEEQNGKLPASQDADVPLSGECQNQTPKSLILFFRKFYQLAHLRLKDLCKNLQFTNGTDLLQKIWTLFQFSITDHIMLMKDRHLDQILMCCVYVLCKIRPNENRHTFADIMKFYRSQPQADSHIYRSVFIEYTDNSTNNSTTESGNARSNAAEPEVVSGRSTVYGTESRGDIIYFYNKIFVPKMQAFAMGFSNSSQNNLLLSPLPHTRPLISPRKISPYHDVYVQPMTRQSVLSPSARTLTFTIEQSPSKLSTQDLQKINNLINKDRKAAVAKRFNMDSDSDYPPNKMSKEMLLISDREEVSN